MKYSFILIFQSVALFSVYFQVECQETVVLDSSDLSVVVRSPSFVDKTRLIKTLTEGSRCSILTAPPKFGKSLALDVIERFFQVEVSQSSSSSINLSGTDPSIAASNYRLFSDHSLAIAKEVEFVKGELGKTPVVRVNFKRNFPHNVPIKCLYDAMNAVKGAVHAAFVQHKYLASSNRLSEGQLRWVRLWCDESGFKTKIDPLTVDQALPALAQCLDIHFGRKVIILVDDHDHVVLAAAQHVRSENELRDVTEYVTKVLNALVTEDSVRLLAFSGVSTNPHTNGSYFETCVRYGFPGDHPFAPYFGFTEREVADLFSKKDFTLDPKEVEIAHAHYGGYRSESPRASPVYSPFSVLNFIKTGKVGRYFTGAEFSKFPTSLLGVESVQLDVDKILHDKCLEVEIPVNVTVQDFMAIKAMMEDPKGGAQLGWNPLYVLIEWGFFTYVPSDRRHVNGANTKRVTINVPNAEVKEYFINKILELKLADI